MSLPNHPSIRPASVDVADIPPLVDGARMLRPEFERRYHQMPGVNKAQLIEGVVHMPSPVRIRSHSEPHAEIMTVLGTYKAFTPGTAVGDNGSIRLDRENMTQPDAYLRILESHGGQSTLAEDDYLDGAPELVVEIASSSAAIDLHDKLRAYRRNGVQEYVVWLADENDIRFHTLTDEGYVTTTPGPEGIVQSTSFPGLWFDVAALLSRDTQRQLQTLRQGIESPEHAAFVTRLREARRD